MMTDVSGKLQNEMQHIKRVSSGQYFTLNPAGSLQTKLMVSSMRNLNDKGSKNNTQNLRLASQARHSSSVQAFIQTGGRTNNGFGFNQSQNQVGSVNTLFMNSMQQDGAMVPFQFNQPIKKIGANDVDIKMSIGGNPNGFSNKIDSKNDGKWNQARANVMQFPTEEINRNIAHINRQHNYIQQRAKRNDIKMSASNNTTDEMFGKPQKDPEDPTVTGDTNFEQKKDYMDQMIFQNQMKINEYLNRGELLINTDKLTQGRFNITVPLRESYLNDQFQEIGLENNLKNRERFYEMLYTTPNLSQYTSGAILTDELIRNPEQKFQKILKENYQIIGPSIHEYTTLENLEIIAEEYYDLGCRFAVIRQNILAHEYREASRQLAKKAKICQDHGIVPILRPVMNEYPAYNQQKIGRFFDKAFPFIMDMLKKEDVFLEGTIICVGTITSCDWNIEFQAEDRAFKTAQSLSRFVPTEIGGIIVDSTNIAATRRLWNDQDKENIDALTLQKLKQFQNPWRISARVSQRGVKSTLNVWNGQYENSRLAQDTFRFILNDMYQQNTVSQQISQEKTEEKVLQ